MNIKARENIRTRLNMLTLYRCIVGQPIDSWLVGLFDNEFIMNEGTTTSSLRYLNGEQS